MGELDTYKEEGVVKKQPVGEDGTGNSYICLTGNKCNVGVWGGREGRSDGSGCEEVGERERDTERKRDGKKGQ